MSSAQKKAEEFLKNAGYFNLGTLPTEASHPKTTEISDLALHDLNKAIKLLQQVDIDALKKLESYTPQLKPLADAIDQTFKNKGRIFLCGCGATGRLSLSLEYLWRRQHPDKADAVMGFMAGGDVALVHSIENFEDFTEYGADHLMQLGFTENDLLISSTEGGETSYVIGATEKAAQISKQKPFFLYCNPKDILMNYVERSRRVLTNPNIHNICLDVGPMALSGSTRMQASTVLMLAIGLCLFEHSENDLKKFIEFFENSEIEKLDEFIKLESDIYQKSNRIIYSADDLAITVFTDTTERSPTFSLPAFSHRATGSADASLAYLMIPTAADAQSSWNKLLLRNPRPLQWKDRSPKTTSEYLQGFDFSKQVMNYRRESIPSSEHFLFSIERQGEDIQWKLLSSEAQFQTPQLGELFDHILLKMFLNTHSTLIMARLGRTTSNFMTYVTPTNGKLIDRAARYTLWLLKKNNIQNVSYEQVVHELFRQHEQLQPGEAIVLKTFNALK